MNSILSANGRGVLEDLAARRALLAFDFDGTLAPIVGDRAAACAPVTAVASSLEGARVCRGHAVVHVVPRDAPDKKAAVQEVLRRAGPRPVLYVGDDRTDEDVFSSVDVGVRVGRTARSTASWYLAAQGAMDDLLRALLAARTRIDGRGARADGLVLAVGD